MSLQDQYDEAMFDFSRGEYDGAIARLRAVLEADPAHFEAQLALGMAYCRKGDYATAIAEGHKAERLKPGEQLVHTNLSLFYMKAGDKKTAEHHGLQARIASWKSELASPDAKAPANPELDLAKAAPPGAPQSAGQTSTPPPPAKFPSMPWKKKP